ncbi:MAG: hypothetical protein K6G12_02550 [Lachnospiraceae bacterium]|nr:hypothetical protein [Lachnospiraceae bacterium]
MSNIWKPLSAEEIENKIEKLASSYVPEWNFDRNNPDIGSVIAQVFARQTEENYRLMSLMPERYHLEFVNMLDFSLHPAQPAGSMVVFNLYGGVIPGSQLPKGTRLSAESEEADTGYVVYETDRNIYVTEAQIRAVFETDKERGLISPVFGEFAVPKIVPESAIITPAQEEGEIPENIVPEPELFSDIVDEEVVATVPPFVLFGEKSNLGQSVLTLYHNRLFDGVDEPIYVRLSGGSTFAGRVASREFCFKYLTAEGFKEFDKVRLMDDNETFELTKSEESAKVDVGDKELSVVTLSANDVLTDSLAVTDISLSAGGASKAPEYVGDGQMELEVRKFNPFSDTIAVYNECYIGHDPCFSKSGARISLNFKVTYHDNQIRLTAEQEEAELTVVKRKPKKMPFDNPSLVKVDEVTIEYYNGIGWKKLHCDTEYAGMFENTEDGDYKLNFICPEDWVASESGPYSGRSLRMRVTRSDNCYMRPAIHTYPTIENMKISYSYEGKFVPPTKVEMIAGTVKSDITDKLGLDKEFTVLAGSNYAEDTLFIGLDRKLEEGPISIYFQLADINNQNGVRFRMEYSSSSGFKEMRYTDLTEDFTRSGTLMFLPPADMAEMTIEGNRLYWIKIVRSKVQKNQGSDVFLPHIVKLCLNAVTVTNVQTSDETDYYIDEVMPNMRFSLGSGNILDAEIWVNEVGVTRKEDMERLLSEYPEKVRAEYDFLGRISGFYVLWSEVENFANATDRRSYRIDRMTGTVMFSDGTNCDIPRVVDDVAFKARIRSTDGERGNLGEGMITEFAGDAPYIDSLYNPIRAHGGSNLETLDHALLRGAGIMHARGKLVSEGDYVRHIMEFSDSIERSRVVPGLTIDGLSDPSDISIVLLMKDFADGAFSFHRISALLKKDLLKHCELTISEENLHIVEPIFVDISVTIWATVMDMDDSFEVQNELKSVLATYLNPVSDENNAGWNIGVLPKESQILMRLSVLRSRAIIQRITVIGRYTDADGEHEMDTKDIEITPFMVPKSGTHKVIVTNK